MTPRGKAAVNPNATEWVSTSAQRDHAWRSCAEAIERHYEERLKRWNAELDMLLVFAGLFSTALTAFIVQSYPLLQPDETQTVIIALAYISSQMESFTVTQPFVNSTQRGGPFLPALDAVFVAPAFAIWINALWFCSLVCTLSASSIAVLVKQWLYQCSQSLSGTSPDVARLRQYRYDNLLEWRVPEIIAALPMLLQIALTLFLSGLLILLWTLHPSVAISATILVGLLVLFISMTTYFPAVYPDCCYQSTQALAFLFLTQGIAKAVAKLLRVVEALARKAASDTTSFASRRYVALAHIRDGARSLLKILGPMTRGSFSDWQAREKPDVDAKHSELEQSLALTAYRITQDNAALNTTVIPCLSGMDALSLRMSVRYTDVLLDVTGKIQTRDWKVWRPVMPFVLIVLSLITGEADKGMIGDVLQTMPVHPLSPLSSKLGMLYLHAMSQLVSRRIAPKAAFQNILVYLHHARLDQEKSHVLGSSVLEDVEASFPMEYNDFQELLDMDEITSVSLFFTGIEYTITYLLRHRHRLEQDGYPVPKRINSLLRGFTQFLMSYAWRHRRTRQDTVVSVLRWSSLPMFVCKLKQSARTGEMFKDVKVMEALADAFSVIAGESPPANSEAPAQTTREVLAHIRHALEDDKRITRPVPPRGPPAEDGPGVDAEGSQSSSVHPQATERTPHDQTVPQDETVDAGASPEDAADILRPWTDLTDADVGNIDTPLRLDHDMVMSAPIFSGPMATIPTEGHGEVPDSPLPDPAIGRSSLLIRSRHRRSGLPRNRDLPQVVETSLLYQTRPLPALPPPRISQSSQDITESSEPPVPANALGRDPNDLRSDPS